MNFKGWKGKIVGGEQHYQKGDHHLFVSVFKGETKAQLFLKGREKAISHRSFPEDATLLEVIRWANGEILKPNPSKNNLSKSSHAVNPLGKVRKGMSEAQQRKIVSHNIAREVEAGKPQRQAVAIALEQRRRDLGLPARKNPSKKGLVIKEVSCIDERLSPQAIKYIQKKLNNCKGTLVKTFRLPQKFGMVESSIYGPVMGDPPIKESQVKYARIGSNKWASRVINRPIRKTSMVTVIAAPHEGDACVLHTVLAGPLVGREPNDPVMQKHPGLMDEAKEFWSKHAFADPNISAKNNPGKKTRYSQPVYSASEKDHRERFVRFLPEKFEEAKGSEGKILFSVVGGHVTAEDLRDALGDKFRVSDNLQPVYVSRGEYVTFDRYLAPKYGPIITTGVETDGSGRWLVAGKVISEPNRGKDVKFLLDKLTPMPSESVLWHGPLMSRSRKMPAHQGTQSSGSEIIAGLLMSRGMEREKARASVGLTPKKASSAKERVPESIKRQIAAAYKKEGKDAPPKSVIDQMASLLQEKKVKPPRDSTPKKKKDAESKPGAVGKHQEKAESLDLYDLDYEMDNMSDAALSGMVADMAEEWTISEEMGSLTKDFGKEGRKKWSEALKIGNRKLKNRGLYIEYSLEDRVKLLHRLGFSNEDIAKRTRMRESEVVDIIGSDS